jgi:Ca2+-binding RTX toxin-like protein
MPKLTLPKNAATVPNLVLDRGDDYNFIDDLRTINYIGGTLKFDAGTNDTIFGTNGNDSITVHNGNDVVHANGGDDIMTDLGGGNDQFFGDDGNDRIKLGAGNDVADGGAGIDTLDYTGIDFMVIADLNQGFIFAEGIDQAISIENIIGSDWNDTLMGTAGRNAFYGQGGNDTIKGGGGRDSLFGGDGNDTISGAGGMYGGTGDDIITSTYRRRGSQGDLQFGEGGDDTMTGNNGNDTMYGGFDDDVMKGGAGEDYLHGGSGHNILTGGLDRDVFAFQSFGAGHSYDTITDFERNYDKIDLSAIDADPTMAGNQAFELHRGPRINHDGIVHANPGPMVNGYAGTIDIVHQDGRTYIYVDTEDGPAQADIVLEGNIRLTADNFIF